MAWPAALKVALKEWASVCGALERGRQMILLRKGGIYEAAGEFEIEHRRFVLFPTYLHQNLQMLKPGDQGDFEPAKAEPEQILISAAAEITDIVQLKNRGQMDPLEPEHVWTPPLIDMRFNYRPENPLYLLLVRTYRLVKPVTIQNTLAYAGCKSWVPLNEAIQIVGATPAIAEEAFESRRRSILERVA
jgi:hypothetical protein